MFPKLCLDRIKGNRTRRILIRKRRLRVNPISRCKARKSLSPFINLLLKFVAYHFGASSIFFVVVIKLPRTDA